jgi:hypothetical protein
MTAQEPTEAYVYQPEPSSEPYKFVVGGLNPFDPETEHIGRMRFTNRTDAQRIASQVNAERIRRRSR